MNKLKGKTAVITGGTAALDWHRRRSSPGRGKDRHFRARPEDAHKAVSAPRGARSLNSRSGAIADNEYGNRQTA